jgi:hypothetical protein
VAGSLEIGSLGDSDPITGLAAFQGNVVCFKQASVWQVAGTAAANFYVRRIKRGVGCVNDRSIVEANDILYFGGQDDIYRYDGGDFQRIGKKVKDNYRGREFSRDRFMIAEHNQELGMILFQWTPGGGSANTDGAALFYEHSTTMGTLSWCPWSFGATGMASMARLKNPTTQQVVLVYGFENGSVGEIVGYSDDGLPIEFYWTGPRVDAEFPGNFKQWGDVVVDFNRQAVESLVEIWFAKEEITAPSHWQTHDSVVGVFRGRLGRSSRTLQLKIRGNSTVACEVASFSLRAEVAGRV